MSNLHDDVDMILNVALNKRCCNVLKVDYYFKRFFCNLTKQSLEFITTETQNNVTTLTSNLIG